MFYFIAGPAVDQKEGEKVFFDFGGRMLWSGRFQVDKEHTMGYEGFQIKIASIPYQEANGFWKQKKILCVSFCISRSFAFTAIINSRKSTRSGFA